MKPPTTTPTICMDPNQRWRFFSSLAHCVIFLMVFMLISTSCQFPGFGRSGPDCGLSTLKIGESVYELKTIKPRSDGSLKIPADRPDTAYWVEGTEVNYVFGLSPTPNNLSLEGSLTAGDQVTITWDNCNSTAYTLSAPQSGSPNPSVLLDQSISGITIFVQTDSSRTGFVVRGELAEETITTFNTPDPSEIQAEISLLETTTSADGKSIMVGISILNYGKSAITISERDISLTPENASPMAPIRVEPLLPREIEPGETVTLQLTFPRLASQTATLKILTVEYEVEY